MKAIQVNQILNKQKSDVGGRNDRNSSMVIEKTDPSLTSREERSKEGNSFKLSSIKRLKDPTVSKGNLSNKKIYRMGSKSKVAGKNSKLETLNNERNIILQEDLIHQRKSRKTE